MRTKGALIQFFGVCVNEYLGGLPPAKAWGMAHGAGGEFPETFGLICKICRSQYDILGSAAVAERTPCAMPHALTAATGDS
jgi:hypothetical protein